jgi:hypothetical protein
MLGLTEKQLVARMRQIEFVIQGVKYQAISPTGRPAPPSPFQNCSKRNFEGQLCAWRRKIARKAPEEHKSADDGIMSEAQLKEMERRLKSLGMDVKVVHCEIRKQLIVHVSNTTHNKTILRMLHIPIQFPIVLQ